MFAYLFLDHPRSVGETYWEHARTAFSFAGALAIAATCCAVHGLVPRLFEYRASRTVATLHDRMVKNRVRADQLTKPTAEASGSTMIMERNNLTNI